MKAITLNLAVKDIKETIKYYQENFDFEVQMLVDESKTIFDTQIKEDLNYVWAMIYKDNVSLILSGVSLTTIDVFSKVTLILSA